MAIAASAGGTTQYADAVFTLVTRIAADWSAKGEPLSWFAVASRNLYLFDLMLDETHLWA